MRENNQAADKTWVWTYDSAGNIQTRAEYAYTTASLEGVTPTDTVNYTYGDDDWGDLLTAYDGVAISYDEIGNPLSDGTWTYTWEHGRELASMTDGTTTWTYTYNADGMRTTRSNGTATYKYVYNGSSLVQMTVGSDTLYFTDATVTYNNTVYYYVKNIQGDIVAILDTDGEAVVQYTYDAWGNILTTTGELANTLGQINPLRYRGYVYDSETCLYYLQSRYYDPEVGRFLNADAFASTAQGVLGNNMFAYCGNNPVMGYDPSGMINWGGVLAGLVIGAIAVAAIVATIATAGAASPVVAAVGTAVGTAVSAALVETAVVTTIGAYCEAPVVYDVCVVTGNNRSGCSVVYDYNTDITDVYLHEGAQNKPELGVTYGAGFVGNYDEPGQYAGAFVDVSYSVDYKGANIGVDACTSPGNIYGEGGESYAVLFTSGWSVPLLPAKTAATYSYDVYWQVGVY